MTSDYQPVEPKIAVELVGTDGNAFALIGRVARGLRKAGRHEDAAAFVKEATTSGSYDGVIRTILKYVEVE